MLFQLPSSVLFLALLVLTEASQNHGAHLANMRRRHLNPRASAGVSELATPTRSVASRRRACKAKSSSALSSSSAPTSSSAAAAGIVNVGGSPTTTSTTDAHTTETSTTTTKQATHTKATPTTTSTQAATTVAKQAGGSGALPTVAGPAGQFAPVKPSDWPSVTQAGAKPSYTVATSSDPYLKALSEAMDNSGNSLFTEVKTGGDMTYYGQGLGACGDVYDNESFTAAVSEIVFDAWPGADGSAQNRNPICGPFVPGRQALTAQGLMATTIKSSVPGFAQVGGDGLINCVGSADVQCHVPLTATVTHGSKSIQVRIVDRCVGCKPNDIDLTPAAFAALADPALGRTSVTWQFNNW
ncbi:unnamed protein product [Mycena citricolor]|uniref:RlpA-like protein double-psi beta-barrel domain-containing protein n=1 Tax=Mycena citricolor TaxID=2018698 RepID=A0AAD2HF27_9AGAR|nr:unnamed protein product [Mycena citricolor]